MADNTIQNNDPRTDEQIQLRRLFVRKVYLLALSFAVAVLVQCLLFAPSPEEWKNIGMGALFILGFIPLILLSCWIIFLCFPSILMIPGVNWCFLLIIVETFTLLMILFTDMGLVPFCVIVTINIIAMAALVVIAWKMPCDLTKIGVWLNVISIFIVISFVGAMIIEPFLILFILFYMSIMQILILALVIMYTIYYAQLVQGGRYNELELNQVMFAALVHFCILMVMNIWLTALYSALLDWSKMGKL